MSLLEINNLEVRFDRSAPGRFSVQSKAVLHDLSLSLNEGETLGIIGESGSGKSTLARTIAGIVSPVKGTIVFDGINIYPEIQNRKTLGTKIQMVFQAYSSSLDPHMTIGAIIGEGLHSAVGRNNGGTIGDDVMELCSLLGLSTDIVGRFPSQISGGQRQRVSLARAISVRPRLLILDEPTSSLDVLTQSAILSLIKRIHRQYALGIIFISHNIENSIALCDRTAVLHKGSIVETGIGRSLWEHPTHPYTKQLIESMHQSLRSPRAV